MSLQPLLAWRTARSCCVSVGRAIGRASAHSGDAALQLVPIDLRLLQAAADEIQIADRST